MTDLSHLLTDFTIENYGSIFLLTPASPEAVEWAATYLPEDAQTWGESIVVEPRYIDTIATAIISDGLSVS